MSRYMTQLLALVAVAEQRPLSAEEAELLRDRIRALDAYRRQVGGLEVALSRARQAQEGRQEPASRPPSASMDSGTSGLENASEAHSPTTRPKNQTKAA